MSVIAVKKYEDRIEIAADTIEVRGNLIDRFPKLIKNDKTEFYVGTAGDARYCEYLLHYCKENKPFRNDYFGILDFFDDVISKMVETFGVEIKDIYEELDALFVLNDKVWVLNYGLKEITDYYAIGAADREATTLLHIGKSPRETIEIACEINSDICLPVTEFIIKTKYI